MVVSAPDTGGRYYLLPMLDMWTRRVRLARLAHDGHAGRQLPGHAAGWRPDLRDKVIEQFKLPEDTQRIDAPTPYVWIIGRTKTDGPADYDAVHKIQAGYKITPLSRVGQAAEPRRGQDRSERRHEDAAEGAGRYHAGGQVLRLCGRASEAPSAAHHRPADHRADEADRHRARQELRHRARLDPVIQQGARQARPRTRRS